jgi:predicted lipid-binding transport protein (Tim44 family)
MKKLAVLIFVFALSAVSVKLMAQQTQQAQPAAKQVVTPNDKPGAPANDKDEHPHMDAAKKALDNAKNQLQQAVHDYNGHRAKALDLVDQALKEINEGLKWEENNKETPKK